MTFRGYFLVSSRATFSDILAKAHDERVATGPAHLPRAEVSKPRSARRLNRRIDRRASYRKSISAIRALSFVAARVSRQTRGPARPLLGREIGFVRCHRGIGSSDPTVLSRRKVRSMKFGFDESPRDVHRIIQSSDRAPNERGDGRHRPRATPSGSPRRRRRLFSRGFLAKAQLSFPGSPTAGD